MTKNSSTRPSATITPARRRATLGHDDLARERVDHACHVDDTLRTGAQLGDAFGRGSRVLRQHERRLTRFEQRGVPGDVGDVGDDVELQIGPGTRPVVLGDRSAEPDDHRVRPVAQRAEHRVVVAVPEPAGQTGHRAATVGRRDHVQPHEAITGAAPLRQRGVLGHHDFGGRTVLTVEDPHACTLGRAAHSQVSSRSRRVAPHGSSVRQMETGDIAPDFELATDDGGTLKLSDALEKGPGCALLLPEGA